MIKTWLDKIQRGYRKPPKVIIAHFHKEIRSGLDYFLAPQRHRKFTISALLRAVGAASVDELWAALAKRPYPAQTSRVAAAAYERLCPGDGERILAAAAPALRNEVNLLGSGPRALGDKIDWHKDYKSGYSWAPGFFRSIDYHNPERPSDVKIPWEISRLQWLIPAGQAYLLTGEERYAEKVRDTLADWIEANPYAQTVNWACTMEVAMRILTWTWFFQVFCQSRAWVEAEFRSRFLRALFLHGDFTERYLEYADINGNHCIADAAGLVFAGLFFGPGDHQNRWLKVGWQVLCAELPRQVFQDGVDFEGSVAYHRLVLELFFFPVLYRQVLGLDEPGFYKERLIAMTRFAAAYSRSDGAAPLWGDADDARALPFGGQAINDHRYLAGLVGGAWHIPELSQYFSGSRSEIFWVLGAEAAVDLPLTDKARVSPGSTNFPDGGFYIMRNQRDHVFIDCGPVGLAGRGGHGHNDCLSFEAFLDGVPLVSDCGAYLYTASYEERNNFRSTGYHNTPRVDAEEINRFIRWEYLWTLRNDALPEIRHWQPGAQRDRFCGAHRGYRRLPEPVTPVRTVILEHAKHALLIEDKFEGHGTHKLEIPLHLAPGVSITEVTDNKIRLGAANRDFLLVWNGAEDWQLTVEKARVSPSYGITIPTNRLVWRRQGSLSGSLRLCLIPRKNDQVNLLEWLNELLDNTNNSKYHSGRNRSVINI